jgi:hypothetical protein
LALIVAVAWRSEGAPQIGTVLRRRRGWALQLGLWLAVVVVVAIVRRLATGGLSGAGTAVPGLAELSGPQRVIAMLSTGGHVAQLLLWPTMQSPDYGPSELAIGSPRVLAALATALTIVLMLLWSGRLAFRANRPDSRPLVAVAWCLIAYFPASNLIAATGPILAERTLYVASIGVAMLVAWSLERIGVWASERPNMSVASSVSVRSRGPLLLAGAVFGVACAREYVHARDYTSVWRIHHSLFTRIVEADSLNYRGYVLLALEAKDFHRLVESAQLYAHAYSLRPSDPLVLADYGEYLLEVGSPRYAMAMGERLMRIPAMRTDARAVTLLLNATGRVWGVDSVLAAAQRLENASPSARSSLFIGLAYDAKRDTTAAQAAYHLGLARAPRDSALAAHIVGRITVR